MTVLFYHKNSALSRDIEDALKKRFKSPTNFFILLLVSNVNADPINSNLKNHKEGVSKSSIADSSNVLRPILKHQNFIKASTPEDESERRVIDLLVRSFDDVGVQELLKKFIDDFSKCRKKSQEYIINGKVEFITEIMKSNVQGYHCVFDNILEVGIRAQCAILKGLPNETPVLVFPSWLDIPQKQKIAQLAVDCGCKFTDITSSIPFELSIPPLKELSYSYPVRITDVLRYA